MQPSTKAITNSRLMMFVCSSLITAAAATCSRQHDSVPMQEVPMQPVPMRPVPIQSVPIRNDVVEATCKQGGYIKARLANAEQLNASERKLASRILRDRLPGDWSRRSLEDVEVLGRVGDKSCLPVLDSMEHDPDRGGGAFQDVIMDAEVRIKDRGQ